MKSWKKTSAAVLSVVLTVVLVVAGATYVDLRRLERQAVTVIDVDGPSAKTDEQIPGSLLTVEKSDVQVREVWGGEQRISPDIVSGDAGQKIELFERADAAKDDFSRFQVQVRALDQQRQMALQPTSGWLGPVTFNTKPHSNQYLVYRPRYQLETGFKAIINRLTGQQVRVFPYTIKTNLYGEITLANDRAA